MLGGTFEPGDSICDFDLVIGEVVRASSGYELALREEGTELGRIRTVIGVGVSSLDMSTVSWSRRWVLSLTRSGVLRCSIELGHESSHSLS